MPCANDRNRGFARAFPRRILASAVFAASILTLPPGAAMAQDSLLLGAKESAGAQHDGHVHFALKSVRSGSWSRYSSGNFATTS